MYALALAEDALSPRYNERARASLARPQEGPSFWRRTGVERTSDTQVLSHPGFQILSEASPHSSLILLGIAHVNRYLLPRAGWTLPTTQEGRGYTRLHTFGGSVVQLKPALGYTKYHGRFMQVCEPGCVIPRQDKFYHDDVNAVGSFETWSKTVPWR